MFTHSCFNSKACKNATLLLRMKMEIMKSEVKWHINFWRLLASFLTYPLCGFKKRCIGTLAWEKNRKNTVQQEPFLKDYVLQEMEQVG